MGDGLGYRQNELGMGEKVFDMEEMIRSVLIRTIDTTFREETTRRKNKF